MKSIIHFVVRAVVLSAMLLSLAAACTTSMPVRPLSRAEAIRIADDEARKYFHGDIKQFEHSPVFYTAAEGCWYVGYLRPEQKFVDFGINVYDKTRKASVLLAP